MTMDPVAKRNFQRFRTCLNFYHFENMKINHSFIPHEDKVIFERNEPTIMKVEASVFKMRPGGLSYDQFYKAIPV